MFRESFNLCAFPWFYSEVCIRPHIRRSTRSLCRYITQKPLLPILNPTIMKIRTERIATSHKVFDGRLLTPELPSNRLETDNYVRTLSLRNSSNTARVDDIRLCLCLCLCNLNYITTLTSCSMSSCRGVPSCGSGSGLNIQACGLSLKPEGGGTGSKEQEGF